MFGTDYIALSGLDHGFCHQAGLRPTLLNYIPLGLVLKGRNVLGLDDNPTLYNVGIDYHPSRFNLKLDVNPTRLNTIKKSPERAIYNKA